jgi:Zn-finger protein
LKIFALHMTLYCPLYFQCSLASSYKNFVLSNSGKVKENSEAFLVFLTMIIIIAAGYGNEFTTRADCSLWKCGNCREIHFENAWHFKDIFRVFEAFLKISMLFEYIFREIEAFLKYFEAFLKNPRLFYNI